MGALTSNPYAAVDWAGQQVTSTTHSHVKEPTATGITEAEYFDELVAAGYRHLAISNYYPSDPASSYPLTNLNGVVSVPDDVIGCPNAEHFRGAGGADGHFGGIGSTASTGSATAGHIGSWKNLFDTILGSMLHADGGGISVNHPNISAYPGDATVLEMLDYDERVLGIEIYDGFTDWSPGYGSEDGYATEVWHRLLNTGRRCYGFAVPDHWKESAGHPATPLGCNRLLVPSSYAAADRATREHLCLQAYRNGQWYCAISLPDSPVLTGVTVTATQITVDFAAACDITFYWGRYGDTEARSTTPVNGTSATYNLTGEEIYVRAEGQSSATARSFTQPIMYEPPFEPIDMKMVMAVLG